MTSADKLRWFDKLLVWSFALPLAGVVFMTIATAILVGHSMLIGHYGNIFYIMFLAPGWIYVVCMVLYRERIRKKGLRILDYIILYSLTFAGLFFTYEWFADVMHDLALIFGSHGRWGCYNVNSDGSNVFYIIREWTVAFTLFIPQTLCLSIYPIINKISHKYV